jgi:hypothetical protein
MFANAVAFNKLGALKKHCRNISLTQIIDDKSPRGIPGSYKFTYEARQP